MRLVLTGRHVEITPVLRRLVDRKLGKLARIFEDGIVSAQVVLTQQKYRHLTDVTVHARGDHMLKAAGDTASWETSLAQAVEKLEQQAQKVKGKWQERKRRATPVRTLGDAPVLEPTAEDERVLRVVRASRYSAKPMTVEEAVLSVDRGHDVLVFRNATTNSINVLYRRQDGDLALIEPES
jgi:putative sigma-54 modulation protein